MIGGGMSGETSYGAAAGVHDVNVVTAAASGHEGYLASVGAEGGVEFARRIVRDVDQARPVRVHCVYLEVAIAIRVESYASAVAADCRVKIFCRMVCEPRLV